MSAARSMSVASTRLRRGLARVHDSAAFDVALAVGLCAVAETEIAAAGELGTIGVAAPFFTLTLAWRRRAALHVALVAATALAVVALFASLEFPSIAAFAAMFAVTYSAGAHLPTSRAMVALAAVLAAVVFEEVVQGGGDLHFAAIVFTVPWLIGRGVRAQREQERAIAEAVARLERERDRNAGLAIAAERLRMARELHDTIAGLLNLVVVQAAVAEQCSVEQPAEAAAALALVHESGRAASADLRRMLGVLRSSHDGAAVAPAPRLDAVDELVARARAAGADVKLTITGSRPELPAGVDLAAYRIVQEALSNVVKHAAGARAGVHVRYGADAVEIEVRDAGGTGTAADSGGHGLIGMRERTAIFGGDLKAARTPDGGFAVRARLPLEGAPV
ncbi:MAG: histidine kinase [Chloroflexi bacterium]|nr:histidine kinase [Chloroflexota bacterium]